MSRCDVGCDRNFEVVVLTETEDGAMGLNS